MRALKKTETDAVGGGLRKADLAQEAAVPAGFSPHGSSGDPTELPGFTVTANLNDAMFGSPFSFWGHLSTPWSGPGGPPSNETGIGSGDRSGSHPSADGNVTKDGDIKVIHVHVDEGSLHVDGTVGYDLNSHSVFEQMHGQFHDTEFDVRHDDGGTDWSIQHGLAGGVLKLGTTTIDGHDGYKLTWSKSF